MSKEEFETLFKKYFEDVRRYILYRSGDGELATDIAQDTFMRVWEKQFDINYKTVKGLLFKIAGDLFITRYHKEKTAFKFFEVYEPDMKNLSPEEELNFQELKNAYEAALESMPEKQRVVFLMSRIDGLKYKEIAEQLGLTIKAIEKRMGLALHHIKENIKHIVTIIVFIFLSLTLSLLINMSRRTNGFSSVANKKLQEQGLVQYKTECLYRSLSVEFTGVNDCFRKKRNTVIGVFLLSQIKFFQ